jgi:hypothetical protein
MRTAVDADASNAETFLTRCATKIFDTTRLMRRSY